jgi:hypothetical protein
LGVVWKAPVVARLHKGAPARLPPRLLFVGSIAVAALHAFALSVILRRYF